MWLIGAGMFFDGFDIYVLATVLGATLKSGFSTMGQNAQFVSATFLGMMLGSFLTGFLGDKYGRRFTYQANLAIFGLASVAAAFAPSMGVLILLRFIIGVGLGAENVVGYSTLTEFIPPQARGKWLGGMSVFVVSGLPAAGLVGTLIIPRFGWRAMFIIGGFGALGVWYLRKALPESPRWLESVGRNEEADAILQAIERESAELSAISANDRGMRHFNCNQHVDLWIRNLVADIFRAGGAQHRKFVSLCAGDVLRRADWFTHWSVHCGLLGAEANYYWRVSVHHPGGQHLSVH